MRTARLAPDSVPALASILVGAALSHPARFALERIPDPRAAEAMRRALPQAEGNVKIGLINSLGVLQDAAAVGLLAELLTHSDVRIAIAAASALGHIGTVEAACALGECPNAAPAAAAVNRALLVAAGRLGFPRSRRLAPTSHGNPVAEESFADAEANRFRSRAMREPWSLQSSMAHGLVN